MSGIPTVEEYFEGHQIPETDEAVVAFVNTQFLDNPGFAGMVLFAYEKSKALTPELPPAHNLMHAAIALDEIIVEHKQDEENLAELETCPATTIIGSLKAFYQSLRSRGLSPDEAILIVMTTLNGIVNSED